VLFSSAANLQKPKGNGSIGAQPNGHHWIRMAPARYPSTDKCSLLCQTSLTQSPPL